MKTKNTKRVWFVDERYPGKLESWLSSMARKGWFLKEVKTFYYVFEKGDPEEMEYRMLYFYKNVFKEHEQRYREAGWDILQLSYEKYLLMAKTNTHPSEEYFTDIEKMQWKQKDRWMWCVQGVLTLIFWSQAIALINSAAPGVWFNYDLWNKNFLNLLMMALAGTITLGCTIEGISGRRYAKSVERLGKEAHHKKIWMYPNAYRIKIVFIVAIVAALISINHAEYTYEEVNQIDNMPLMTAQEVKASTGKAVYKEEYTKEQWLLTGERYCGDLDLGNSEEYIREVYYTEFRSLNKKGGLLSVLYDGFYLEKGTKTEELQAEGIDKIVYAENKEEQCVAAQKGKEVLAVRAPKSIAKEQLKVMVVKKLR